ncbi:MAG: hypothetical protein OXS35_09525, partial [Dehalococcoidia bacterium]|nr:hypothetical protein [Dehalococcoidia bacterium]
MRLGLVGGGVLAGAVLAALAACSGGEELGVSVPVGEPSAVGEAIMTATAEAALKEEEPKAEATVVPPVTVADEPALDPDEDLRARLRERQRQAIIDDQKLRESLERGTVIVYPTQLPSPTPPPLPTVEFPDDIALLSHAWPRSSGERVAADFVRIYRDRDGEIVRETLFAAPTFREGQECVEQGISLPSVDYSDVQVLAGHLPECGGSYFDLLSRP